MIYNQGDVYYPSHIESGTWVAAVTYQVLRLSDGFWYDFNDSTFKNSLWTTKAASLTEDDQGIWINTTGFTTPNANADYRTFYIEDAADLYKGEIISVSDKISSIKVITDQMVFTKANELDVNTKSINDAEVVGDGNATPWDGI